MATGIIESSEHPIEYYDQSTVSQWLELNADNQILPTSSNNATLRRIDRNLWYVYLALYGVFREHRTQTIGKFKYSFFGNHPVSGYIPAVLGGNSDNQFPAVARISPTTGNLTVVVPLLRATDPGGTTEWNAEGTINYVYIQGLFIRREDTIATN